MPANLKYTHSTATATTTSGALLASNGQRRYAILQNNGSNAVFFKVNATAVASQGLVLVANGDSYSMSAELGNLSLDAINGITTSGQSVVLIVEGT